MKLFVKLLKSGVKIVAYSKIPFWERLKLALGFGNIFGLKFVFYHYVLVDGEPKWVNIEEEKDKYYVAELHSLYPPCVKDGDNRSHEPVDQNIRRLGGEVLPDTNMGKGIRLDDQGIGINEKERFHGLDDILNWRLLGKPLPDNVPSEEMERLYTPSGYLCPETKTVYVGVAIPVQSIYRKQLDLSIYTIREEPKLTDVHNVQHRFLYNGVMNSVRTCLAAKKQNETKI